jgi:hypothetical protein
VILSHIPLSLLSLTTQNNFDDLKSELSKIYPRQDFDDTTSMFTDLERNPNDNNFFEEINLT